VQATRDELVEVEVERRPAWAHQDDINALTARRRPRSLHLLPAFDPYVIGPRPREAVVPAKLLPRVYRPQGRLAPVLLVDGRAAGVWSHDVRDGRVHIEVEPFAKLAPKVRTALSEEADELAAFFGGRAELSLRR
jgi:hypothetical protein